MRDAGPGKDAARAADDRRRKRLAKVHVAKKDLGLEADDYRAVVERVTGRRSAGDCTDRQLGDLLAEFGRLGFKGAAPVRRQASSPIATKARALWISLHQLGVVRDPSEAALEAFGRRQLGVDRLHWANAREGFRLIEALKAMADRHGWDQRVDDRLSQAARVRLLKDRLVGAQLVRLEAAGAMPSGPIAADRSGWSVAQLESAAAHLADLIRAAGLA